MKSTFKKEIFKLAPRPSDAVQAMIDGLEEQSKREDFEIFMSLFLGSKGKSVMGVQLHVLFKK